ncbi:MAG TPA: radical SAM protein [Methanomicrobia archaeon]|nr:radical SAM protein [Methanomicrobia archaeon]
MQYCIIDCYTDEPSGLGVPPYLGTYPRYIAGALKNSYYITIDDLRFWKYKKKIKRTRLNEKTDIKTYNLTVNYQNIEKILKKSTLIIVLGVQTPGKYLSAVPGTLHEICDLLRDVKSKKVLTGPAAGLGTQKIGGKKIERLKKDFFDLVDENFLDINDYNKIKEYSVNGAYIIKQVPHIRVIEIETGRGCNGKCSFCVESLKKIEFRDVKDIIKEVKAFYDMGCRYFRLGKQPCFYSYKNYEEMEKLLKALNDMDLKMLHIDNANPNRVITEEGVKITKAIVKYCTSGNVAAFGMESFDEVVIRKNNLNTSPETLYRAVQTLNKYGRTRENGIPKFLPGINIVLGLIGETKETLEINYQGLKRFLDENLLLRRINIRKVVPFPNTKIFEKGLKTLKKNNRFYYSWREKIRENIDKEMLRKVIPENTVLKNVYTEIYDGKTTFGRQFGTYPIVVGIKKRLELQNFYDIRVVDHGRRSVTGVVREKLKKD